MMQQHKFNLKYKKSDIIIINNIKNLTDKNIQKNEYSLNKLFFDPLNSSPPNDFIIKLQKRKNNIT